MVTMIGDPELQHDGILGARSGTGSCIVEGAGPSKPAITLVDPDRDGCFMHLGKSYGSDEWRWFRLGGENFTPNRVHVTSCDSVRPASKKENDGLQENLGSIKLIDCYLNGELRARIARYL